MMENTAPSPKMSLSDTEKFFLKILRHFLHREKNAPPEATLDWEELLRLGTIHCVEGIIYYQIRDFIQTSIVPEKIRIKLFKAYANACYKYERRKQMLQELDQTFQREKIPYMLFKGIDIADFYPMPMLRTMGDFDLLVHAEDKQRAHEVLLSLGFQNKSMWLFEWVYVKNEHLLELHHRLIYNKTTSTKLLQKYFADCWKTASSSSSMSRYHLAPNLYFIFLLDHLHKHFFEGGIGIRFFMDLAVLIQSGKLNWERLEKDLRSVKMWDFAKVCLAFCREWFNILIPVETETLTGEFFLESTSQIMKNGLFGNQNAENQKNHEINLIRKENGMAKAWFHQIFTAIFLPYATVCDLPQYSFVKGRPILLPIVWICDFFHKVKIMQKRPRTLYGFRGIDPKEFQKRVRFLDQWKI